MWTTRAGPTPSCATPVVNWRSSTTTQPCWRATMQPSPSNSLSETARATSSRTPTGRKKQFVLLLCIFFLQYFHFHDFYSIALENYQKQPKHALCSWSNRIVCDIIILWHIRWIQILTLSPLLLHCWQESVPNIATGDYWHGAGHRDDQTLWARQQVCQQHQQANGCHRRDQHKRKCGCA